MPGTAFFFRLVVLFSLVVFAWQDSSAQTGFYVPKKGKIFFSSDTATIFSDVVNEGKFGVGKKAVLRFKGRKWRNHEEATITDEGGHGDSAIGNGGIISFNNDSVRQEIDGGFNAAINSGARFSNLQLDNLYGVELTGGSTAISDQLQFERGLFYLKNNLLVIGRNNPGIITGFNEDRFVVAGSSSNGAGLIRKNVSSANGIVIFPVGSKLNGYAPAAVRSGSASATDFYVNVFDTVLANVISGRILNHLSVNKTWQIGKTNPVAGERTDIYLQHDIREEGVSFRSNRSASYISQYRSGWDTATPQHFPVAGILTSSAINNNYGLNARTVTDLSSNNYFTKFAADSDSAYKTRLWFYAYRTDWSNVRVYWRTNPEINNHYFIVQRSLGNDSVFSELDTVYSRAAAGISWTDLNYSFIDPNGYTGISYYRLKLVDYAGNITYSNIIPVGNRPGSSGAIVWPNPNHGKFFAGINGDARIQFIVIYNVLGQKIIEERVNGRNIIEFNIRIPGTYMVSFVSQSGNFIDTKKVIIPVVY